MKKLRIEFESITSVMNTSQPEEVKKYLEDVFKDKIKVYELPESEDTVPTEG